MEFNNIQLPVLVIAGLYKHSLVALEGEIKDGRWQMADGGQMQIEVEMPIAINNTLAIKNKQKATETKQQPVIKTLQPTHYEKHSGTIDLQPLAKEIPNEKPAPIPIAPAINFKYLGGFGKKISIVIEDHFHPHINDGDLTFLSKLLQACQLSLNDVAIINVVSNKAFSSQLWQLMPPEKMIIFDIDPGTLGLPFRLSYFKLQPWSDCVFLASPSLQALQDGASEKVVQLKRGLWESLKKMFLA